MRIRAFHVDTFGLLQNVTLEHLPAGFAIFLGRNEAGKSTLLDFFRSTLMGYPPRPRGGQKRDYFAGKSGQLGGSLLLDTAAHGLFRLTRRPASSASPVLTDVSGNPLDTTLWEGMLGGITRDVYTTLYGFSLAELQSFKILDSESIRTVLYGASFGLGLRSPQQALKQLDDATGSIFLPSGSKQRYPVALREWEETRKQLRDAEDALARYDALAASIQEMRASLEVWEGEQADLERERRRLERRLRVWEHWEAWRLAGVGLERLPAVPATFPQEGMSRLERALERQEHAAREVRLATEALEQAREAADTCSVDAALLACAGTLRELAECKSSCRSALFALPTLERSLERIHAELEREQHHLGADWTVERVCSMDRSLALREAVERQASAKQVAEAGQSAAQAHAAQTEQELAEALAQEREAQERCDHLPEPMAELDASVRERLQAQLARTEDALRRMPEQEQALRAVRSDYTRALNPLHLQPKQCTPQTLDALSGEQTQIMSLAQAVLNALQEETQAKRLADQAQEAEARFHERVELMRDRRGSVGTGSRSVVDTRRSLVRRAREGASQCVIAEQRLHEAEERLAAHEASAPTVESGKALMAVGGVLGLAGGGALFARQLAGIEQLAITPALVIPLELWLGYLVLLAGIAFIWAGLPRKRPEAERYKVLSAQLLSRKKSLAGELQAARETLAVLHRDLGATTPWTSHAACLVELDALELSLDQERDQCVAGERLDQELEECARELALLHRRTQEQELAVGRLSSAVQTARRQWHDTLMDFGVQSVPAPEHAAEFFVRVDSARLLWSSVERLEAELAAMQQQGAVLRTLAQEDLSGIEGLWETANHDVQRVLEVVREVLEASRKAEQAVEERARATEALRGASARVVRATQTRDEALQRLHEAAEAEDQACAAWQEVMGQLGLDLSLSPHTAREALDCMDRMRELEAERVRLEASLAQRKQERDTLLTPLRALLRELGRSVEPAAFTERDVSATAATGVAADNTALAESGVQDNPAQQGLHWLQQVDSLQQELEHAQQQAAEQRRLQGVVCEQESRVRQVQALLEDANAAVAWLLRMAGADTPEDFLRRVEIKQEREALSVQRQDLEDRLRLAHEDSQKEEASSFSEFLEAFAALDKDNLEVRLEAVRDRLAVLGESIEQQKDAARTNQVRLEALTGSQSVADLRSKESTTVTTLRELALEWSRHALARYLFDAAQRRLEEERQPEVIRVASGIFAGITDGKWIGISASLDDRSLYVLPPHGERVSASCLSQGTQEQLYLALRLAHIRNRATQAEPLPIIMDDVLVNFDPERAIQTAQALAGLCTEGEGHQVLFFTCHPHIARMLQETVHNSVLYTLDKGVITQS